MSCAPVEEKLVRFIRPGYLSVLGGRAQSGRTTLALRLAKVWQRSGVGTLYIAADDKPPSGCEGLWCRHRPHIPFEDIVTFCEEYEQKTGHRLGTLIIDPWEAVSYGNRFGDDNLNLKHALLRLKLFSFEQELKTLIVCLCRASKEQSPRPNQLSQPFIAHEAKVVLMTAEEAGKRKVLVWGRTGKSESDLNFQFDLTSPA